MRCQRCGNQIRELFIYKNRVNVCRKCLIYKEIYNVKKHLKGDGNYKLNYDLTYSQKEASQFILEHVKENKNCVLNAVTGAGKTEIIYPLIKHCIESKKTIGIVIPRKDVVVELHSRIEKDFNRAKVVMVYGGNTNNLSGDIIILTSHQLYRYNNYFDVIVIDEVDAFPFYNNSILNNFLQRSSKGIIVYMSATIPKKLTMKYDCYYLNKRYHNVELDVPKIKFLWGKRIIKQFIKRHKKSIVLIYFPTIKEQLKFSKKFKIKHFLINSKVEKRNELLNSFHNLKQGVILTTLVLERGITFKDCHVIVYKADHELFSQANLVQIAGRVGRKKDYPSGDILFLVNKKTRKVKNSIKFIKKCNE